jgi:hypothetical protein
MSNPCADQARDMVPTALPHLAHVRTSKHQHDQLSAIAKVYSRRRRLKMIQF